MRGSVRKRNSSWYWCFDLGMINGKRKRKEKGGYKTKKEAEEALVNALKEHNETGSVFEPSQISVSDYLNYWFENYVLINCKYNTQINYKKLIHSHIIIELGDYKLNSITPNIVQEFLNKLYKKKLSKSTLLSIYTILNSSFKMAIYPYNFIRNNPVSYCKVPKFEYKEKRIRVVSQEDFKRILEKYPFGNRYYMSIITAYYTGLRIGEVSALTWDNVDLNNKTIKVQYTLIKKNGQWTLSSPKTHSSSRVVEISDTFVNILRKHSILQKEKRLFYGRNYIKYYVDKNGNLYKQKLDDSYKEVFFLCTDENGMLITMDNLVSCQKGIIKNIGIDFSFHDLRHTHATMLIESGANIKYVQKRLGHTDINTTMNTYVEATTKMATEALNLFDNILNI